MSGAVLNEKKRGRIAALRRRHEWLVRVVASKERGGRGTGRELEEAKALQWALELVAEKYGPEVIKPVDVDIIVPLLVESGPTECAHFERCPECGRGRVCKGAPEHDGGHVFGRPR